MSNLPLQPLKWTQKNFNPLAELELTAYSALHEYEITEPKQGKFEIKKTRLGEPDKKSEIMTGFTSAKNAQDEAWAHYQRSMQPYVKQLNLATAVNVLVDACHGASVKGGWWHDLATGEPLQRNKLEMIALIHSEISEAVEGVRKGINDDHLPQYPMEDVEMADALIRIFDYIGGHKLRSSDALVDKLAYNTNRADHKPENRAKDGGKKH